MAWAVLDCEGIQITKDLMCIRMMYVLLNDELTNMYLEFVPCQDIKEIDIKYQNSFKYCRRCIHKLNYYPKNMAGPCYTAPMELQRFINQNNIKIILFKGGQMEKMLCQNLDVKIL